ncbi:transcriptional regulator AsnC [Idiomarina sp.]|uniref:transcriptional regulator AsnC n=1 Tax=Idiomarina sp. TaxID=1874361 RepID=UPI002EABF96B|nr:transcriptional regulator AsnC [Pseudomonadota bacterium]
MKNYKLDNLDKFILETLLNDARVSYATMATQQKVSTATVHVRVEKMRKLGMITGTRLTVDTKKLGYDVCCFIGITLTTAGDYPVAIEKLTHVEAITEAHYTTGHYNIFAKLMTRSIEDLQDILINRIQVIKEVQATDTWISLQQPIARQVKP